MQKVYRALGITFLFLLAVCGTALAQGTQVSGTVSSATTGEKLWGVTVRVKGTQTQTVTDQQGRYALVAPADAVLTFAQIGYRGKEQPIGGQSTIDMSLEQAPTMLQEVVVTGYTSQRRADITGAVTSVNLDPVERQTSASVLQRLDGRVPGVTVQSSGSPGSRSTVRIRGITSFHDNDPLYIIDGTPVQGDSYLNFLNPNDIGEIQVLKDASAASIYGSRAGNGVIIIETKKGRPGGRQARLDVRTGVASPVHGLDDILMQSSLDYFEVIKRSYMNANQGRVDSLGFPIPYTLDSLPPAVLRIYGDPRSPSVPAYTYVDPGAVTARDSFGRPTVNRLAYNYPNLLIMPGSAGTNWWKAVFSPAQFSDANLSVSGGGVDNSYNVSFSYLKQDGTGAFSQFQRGSLRINTAFNVGQLQIGENLTIARQQNYGGIDDGNLGEDNIVGKNILMQPVVPIYDIGGHFASGKFSGGGNNTNPLKFAWARRFDRNTWDKVLGSAFAGTEIVRNLAFKSRFSFNLDQGSFKGFTPTTWENSEPVKVTSLNQNEQRGTEWTLANTFNYTWVTPQHNLSVLVGHEASQKTYRRIDGSIAALVNEDPASRYIDDALGSATTKNVTSAGALDRLLSFFGKADYNYQQRFYVSGTIRRDGSSKFGPGHRWGTFPGFNVGWRLSRESFFPQDGFLSNVMLRFGWGMTGSQLIPGGRIRAKFGGGRNDTFYDIGATGNSIQPGYRQIALGNASLGWETDKSTNVGADLEFAQGRGNLTIDVYNRIAGATKGHGILFDPRLPATAGFADPSVQNVAKMQNKGFDFALAYSGTIGAGKVWSVSLNAGHYKNKILEIAENLTQFFGPTGTRIGTAVINRIGQPIGAFYGLQANGYFPDSADAASHDDALGPCAVPPCQTNAKVGRIRFVDQITVDTNGDGRPDIRDGLITSADRTIIGSPHPDLTAGLDLGFRTGSWDFSATVFGSFGGQIFDAQKDFYVFRDFSTNVVKDRLTNSFCLPADDGCTNPYNQNAKYPRLDQFDASSPVISSYYVESGTYVRLRTVQVGWQVPASLLRWIPSARIYLQAENLFTITGYEGLDPALANQAPTAASGDVRDQAMGIDVGMYPSNRTITIGISTTF
ncbi:MAG TPA: SusC/RagA family TonB-linked outer membrane protein [Gemmatimonadales bacterium]|nr:SusC/RagA family TonB-linked outer membrane protein [Gemmatimonadales bacterium]